MGPLVLSFATAFTLKTHPSQPSSVRKSSNSFLPVREVAFGKRGNADGVGVGRICLGNIVKSPAPGQKVQGRGRGMPAVRFNRWTEGFWESQISLGTLTRHLSRLLACAGQRIAVTPDLPVPDTLEVHTRNAMMLRMDQVHQASTVPTKLHL